jgi:hypothetical protein
LRSASPTKHRKRNKIMNKDKVYSPNTNQNFLSINEEKKVQEVQVKVAEV